MSEVLEPRRGILWAATGKYPPGSGQEIGRATLGHLLDPLFKLKGARRRQSADLFDPS